jgi:hypothetical protein
LETVWAELELTASNIKPIIENRAKFEAQLIHSKSGTTHLSSQTEREDGLLRRMGIQYPFQVALSSNLDEKSRIEATNFSGILHHMSS